MSNHNQAKLAIEEAGDVRAACKTCKFFNPSELKNASDMAKAFIGQFGQCRRSAPTITSSIETFIPAAFLDGETGKIRAESWHVMDFARWPNIHENECIHENEWCGEWEKKR